MNRAIVLSFLVAVTLALGCSRYSPNAGEEIVLVQKPWFFGHGGVVAEPVTTGLAWTAPTTDGVTVNMQPLQINEPFDDLMCKDGVPLDFDAYIRLRVTDSVALVKYFGKNWYETNLRAEFRNAVRDEVKKFGLNETAIDTSAIATIDSNVTEKIKSYLATAEFGKERVRLPVEFLAVTVGKANPPDAVKTQRIATAEQQQRALTEKERKLAEDQRFEAEKSRAAADNAYRNEMGISTTGFIELESIKMMKEVCGDGACTFIVNPGNVTPTISVK